MSDLPMRAGRVRGMKIYWIIALGLSIAAVSSALAFEEQKMRPAQPAGASDSAKAGSGAVELSDPGVTVPRVDSGTKIRVPGLGIIGEIPKMDFGLELLYGASQPRPSEIERSEVNGVMGRVTVPLKPSR